MERRTAEVVLLASLAVVAIAAASATLPSATTSGGGAGSGPAGDSGDGGLLPPPSGTSAPVIDLSVLRPLGYALLAIVIVGLLVYAYLHRRKVFWALLSIGVLAAIVALLIWVLPPQNLSGPGAFGFERFPIGERGGAEGDQSVTPPLGLLLVSIGVLLVIAAAILRSGAAIADGALTDDTPGSEEREAVGRAAGRAADRIEAASDLGNEVYRAWREMTALLDVHRPETSTPGEFATAAIGAGMDRDDVSELTRLFEDVRYGGDEPTGTRERRAVDILRRVEAAYAPDDGAGR